MNEEPTRNLSDHRSFEERVFARFDSMDARLETLESRSYDTRPIWERALKEILESRMEFGELKAEVNELKREVRREVTNRLDQIQSMQLSNRVDIRDAQDRIDKLESRLG